MALGPVRPRFRLNVAGPAEEGIAMLQAAASRPDSGCVSRVLSNHVDLTVIPERRHAWSPCVQLEFREEDGRTVVDGLIGPSPNMWTMFAFINSTVVLAVVFGIMIGVAQMTLGQSAWALWTVPVGAIVLCASYAVSQLGQRVAAEQTRQLRNLVEDTLGAAPSGGS